MSSNNDGNGGDTPSDSGDISSTIGKVSPPKEPGNDAHFEKSGDSERPEIFSVFLVKRLVINRLT